MLDFATVKQRLENTKPHLQKRNELFLAIYSRVYRSYAQYLFHHHKYDFADMINVATETVGEVTRAAIGYQYILLDEVQDLSPNRYSLIKAILRKNPHCKLFAVGDDWQSIYRFTGSNLKLVYDFKQNFNLETRTSYIETTHRFGQPTINLSCQFIQQNPSQSTKKVRNRQKAQTPIRIIFNKDSSTTDGADAQSLRTILQHLIAELGLKTLRQKSLQIISRYNHDYKRIISSGIEIKTRQDSTDIYDIVWRNPQDNRQELKLEFCSMHKAKGITRDIVIVLNMNDDLMGMPAKREHDPIIEALLSHEDDYPYAEERRLFYVAITRARNCTFLIANRKNPSPFILELSSEIRDIYGSNYLK